MDAIAKWNESRRKYGKVAVSVGIGLAVGEVIFGVIGDAQRLEYTVIGETANLAAKLEKHNKVEHSQALATADTMVEALKQDYANTIQRKILKARNVAGVETPLDLLVLI